jgi:hypothetical protein
MSGPISSPVRIVSRRDSTTSAVAGDRTVTRSSREKASGRAPGIPPNDSAALADQAEIPPAAARVGLRGKWHHQDARTDV